MTVAGMILLFSGIAVTLSGVVGLFRFPDTYTRVKALALVGFPGAVLIHGASSLVLPPGQGEMRGWITAFFFFMAGPVLSHVLLLASHLRGVPRGYPVDELEPIGPGGPGPPADGSG